jgi:phage terminase Nu1 subunit (DNA packaging protein)
VKELVAEGVLQTGADLDECRVNYIRYLRGNASGQHTGAGLKLTDERARLAKLQADKVEIELAELRGEVVHADDVAKVMQAHHHGSTFLLGVCRHPRRPDADGGVHC